MAVQSASASGVGAASVEPGRLDVFFRYGHAGYTGHNQDSLIQVTRINGFWQPPQNLGGSVHVDSDVAVTSPVPGRLDVTVRGADNKLRTRVWRDRYGWSSWINHGDLVTGGPAALGYGSNRAAIIWRSGTGGNNLKIRTAQSTSGLLWSPASNLNQQTAASSGVELSTDAAGKLRIDYRPYTPPNVYQSIETSTSMGSSPVDAAGWTAGTPVFPFNVGGLTFIRAKLQRLKYAAPAGVTGGEMFWSDASNRKIMRLSPAPVYATEMGSPAAGGFMPGDGGWSVSMFPNTPAATWSDRTQQGNSTQLDLIWRDPNGCLRTRSKTDPAAHNWSAEVQVPTELWEGSQNCKWPARTGTLPLLKRVIGADNTAVGSIPGDMAASQAAFQAGSATSPVYNWYSSRYSALMFNQSDDWATSWQPRNWAQNGWVYRKSTSYGAYDNLHDAPSTSSYFVRTTGASPTLVALDYGCVNQAKIDEVNAYNASHDPDKPVPAKGCTQPLLNVTMSAAQNYWLYGTDGKISFVDTVDGTSSGALVKPPGSGDCHGVPAPSDSGILDLLACVQGPWSDGHSNYEGVWLDDVLPDVVQSAKPTSTSRLGNFVSGEIYKNQDIVNKLPFTETQWADGLATMVERLQSGIARIKAKGLLRNDQGIVAGNYKWSTFDFAEKPTVPTISATSAEGRIIKALDLLDLEDGWVDELVPNNASQWSFGRRQNFVDQVHALGGNVLEEKTNCTAFVDLAVPGYLADCSRGGSIDSSPAHVRAAQYNLANTLLNFKEGDWVGDIGEYYGRSFPGYELDLGAPLPAPAGDRTTLSNGVQQRLFERGRAVVVPPSATAPNTAVSVSVPVGSVWYKPSANISHYYNQSAFIEKVTSGTIELYPRQGAVLLNP